MNENIVNYIRQYRFTYTREALTSELLKQGYSPADIEASWQLIETGPLPTGMPPYQPSPDSDAPYQSPPSSPASPPPGLPSQPPPHTNASQLPYYLPARPRLRSNPQFWLTFLGYLFGVPLLFVLLTTISVDLAFVFACLAILAAVIAAFSLSQRNYGVSRGLLLGLITLVVLPVVLSFVTAVIIAGICLVVNRTY